MYKHILVPTDGSELSEKAIKSAVSLAKALNARLTGLFVIPKPSPGDIWDVWTPEDSDDAKKFRTKFEESFRCVAERHLSVIKQAAQEAGITCECLFVTGDLPSEDILKAAEDRGCDLIMMASHGRTGIKGTLLGSVTMKVLGNTKIPVLVHR